MECRMLIITKEAKRVMESCVFRYVFTRFGFLRWDTWFRGTLAFPDWERSEQRRTNRLLIVQGWQVQCQEKLVLRRAIFVQVPFQVAESHHENNKWISHANPDMKENLFRFRKVSTASLSALLGELRWVGWTRGWTTGENEWAWVWA